MYGDYVFLNFLIFRAIFLIFFFHKNFLLLITNTTKKELAKSVQSFTRYGVTKGNRYQFLYI
jgi:hypothetical protein